MTKLSGETFSMMRTPRPELPILFSVHKLCLCTRIMYSSWNLFLVSSTMQECTKMYDFAQKISIFFLRVIPPDPQCGKGEVQCIHVWGQSPSLAFCWLRACCPVSYIFCCSFCSVLSIIL